MIEKKVQGIIDRVKGINAELQLYSAPKPPLTEISSETLPSAPTGPSEESEPGGGEARDEVPEVSAGDGRVGDEIDQLREEHPMEDGGKSLQEWLSSMPDGFVEINPTPYEGSPQSPATNNGDASLTPAQQYFQELADDAEQKERQTQEKKPSARDPFRTLTSSDQIPPGKKACFACGAIMDQADPFCTFCGTKLD
jgi:hypothetical protein